MNEQNKSNGLGTLAKGAGIITAAGLGAAAGWTAWSALFIDHRVQLPPAIRANRYVTATPLSGRLSFYADESASGRPLVLLHSMNAAASAYEMRPLFEYFRDTRPVFALDLPGFGFSERADRNYNPDIYVQSILDFIDGELAGSEAVDMIALSLSSEFAAIAAVEQPSFINSLTLIAPTGFTTNPPMVSGPAQRALGFPLWSQAVYDLLVTRPSIEHFLKKAFAGPVDRGLLEYDYLTSHRPGARYAPFAFVSGRLFTSDILDYYAGISQPVLAFYDASDYGPSELLPRFCRDHENWEMASVAGTKAMPQFENCYDTGRVIHQFLQKSAVAVEI